MTSVCLYVISSQSARRTACVLQQRVRNVPEAAGKHICVCVVTIVYVSNKLSNCLGFVCVVQITTFSYQRVCPCFCVAQIFLFVSRKRLRLALKVFLCLKHTNFM